MPGITRVTRVKATPERVFEAITTAQGISKWWTRDVQLDSAVGGVGEFAFFERKVVTKVRIDALQPPRRVAWTTLESNAPGGWRGTTIMFDLRADGGETVISFAHRGFKEANEGFERVTSGWAYYLESLKQFLETGQGTPR